MYGFPGDWISSVEEREDQLPLHSLLVSLLAEHPWYTTQVMIANAKCPGVDMQSFSVQATENWLMHVTRLFIHPAIV